MYYCSVVGWQENERCDGCYKCRSCQMVLTEVWSFGIFFTKGLRGDWREWGERWRSKWRRNGCTETLLYWSPFFLYFLFLTYLLFLLQPPNQCNLLFCLVFSWDHIWRTRVGNCHRNTHPSCLIFGLLSHVWIKANWLGWHRLHVVLKLCQQGK